METSSDIVFGYFFEGDEMEIVMKKIVGEFYLAKAEVERSDSDANGSESEDEEEEEAEDDRTDSDVEAEEDGDADRSDSDAEAEEDGDADSDASSEPPRCMTDDSWCLDDEIEALDAGLIHETLWWNVLILKHYPDAYVYKDDDCLILAVHPDTEPLTESVGLLDPNTDIEIPDVFTELAGEDASANFYVISA